MKWLERRRQARLHRLGLKLADAEEHYRRWRWSLRPSEEYHERREIIRLRRKIRRLEGVGG